MEKRYLKCYVTKADKDNGILSVAIATDDSIDRDGERIDPNGWDFSNFIKNPVLIWAHDYRREPVGKCLDIRKDGNRILFTPQFAVNVSEFAKTVFGLYLQGFMNAFSVGFIPREWKDEQMANGQTVRTFTKCELLEISAVPVPANPAAVVLARASMGEYVEAKGITDAMVKEMPECTEHTDFGAAAKSMAILMGAGGSTVKAEDRKSSYDHLSGHYLAAGKEVPEYDLIEKQSLKDVNVNIEKHIILEVVKAGDDGLAGLREDILNLQKFAAGQTGIGSAEVKGSAKVATVDALFSEMGMKRLLQHLDKVVGEVLRRAK